MPMNSAVGGVLALSMLLLSGCGGSSSTSTEPPDFALALNSTSLYLPQRNSVALTVALTALNGFNSNVAVTLSGIPASATASPSSFTVAPGGSQKITISASANATPAIYSLSLYSLSLTGTSGSTTHSTAISLQIAAPQGANAPFRLRFYSGVGGNAFYHQPTKRFFVLDGNQILVYDPTTETEIAAIYVPAGTTGPIDQTLDQSTLYFATLFGDIWGIDPVTMTISTQIPNRQIGPSGYRISAVHPLANGEFALAGDFAAVASGSYNSAYYSFAIWNSANNTFTKYTTAASTAASGISGTPVCGGLPAVSAIYTTVDRTKLMLIGNESATICELDPVSGRY